MEQWSEVNDANVMLLFSIQSIDLFIPFIRFMCTHTKSAFCMWLNVIVFQNLMIFFEEGRFFRFFLLSIYALHWFVVRGIFSSYIVLYWHDKELEHYGRMNWIHLRISLFIANFRRTDQESAYFPLFHANTIIFLDKIGLLGTTVRC